jgi:flagellar protein FliO/FliZ
VKYAARLVPILALLLPVAVMAEEATAPVFAVPAASASPATGAAGGMGQVTLALLLVLAAIFGVAWFMRRLRGLSGGAASIDILAQVALGARERAVVIKVGDEQYLLGVAPGRVNLLQVLPEGSRLPAPAFPGQAVGRPDFAALLKKSLGR